MGTEETRDRQMAETRDRQMGLQGHRLLAHFMRCAAAQHPSPALLQLQLKASRWPSAQLGSSLFWDQQARPDRRDGAATCTPGHSSQRPDPWAMTTQPGAASMLHNAGRAVPARHACPACPSFLSSVAAWGLSHLLLRSSQACLFPFPVGICLPYKGLK